MSVDSDGLTAVAIRVNDRFFVRFSKWSTVLTAWSLAGATLFGPWRMDEVQRAVDRIYRTRPKATVELVWLVIDRTTLTIAPPSKKAGG